MGSATSTQITAPSVAPIVGIRSHTATTNANGKAKGTRSAVSAAQAVRPATSEIRRFPSV